MGNDVSICSVVVENALYSFDKPFDYLLPDGMCAHTGQRVTVPFGRKDKKRIGVIVSVSKAPAGTALKCVSSVIDDGIELSDEFLSLMTWIKENTFCTYFDAVKTILPGGLALNITEKYTINPGLSEQPQSFSFTDEESDMMTVLLSFKASKDLNGYIRENISLPVIGALLSKSALISTEIIKQKANEETQTSVRLTESYLNGEYKGRPLTPKQKKTVDFLLEAECASVKELCYNCAVTKAVIDNLEKAGVITRFQSFIQNFVAKGAVKTKSPDDIVLSDEQAAAFSGIKALIDSDKPECALLKGVTGSGKTTVFIKLIEYALSINKTALMLVPEISLTPQMVKCFTDYFGDKIALIHSNLTLSQRISEYKRVKNGEAPVVIGTRSAVFSPLENIGIIVIDEEGEHTYKSEKSPRYHARNIAKQRCFYHGAALLLASATPCLETAYCAQTGRYHLFEMKKRYNRALLPDVYIVDMKVERELGRCGNFSEVLENELKENFSRGEQSMILLNRRGYNTYMSCLKCGAVYYCPNCSIPLTYHRTNDTLMCHYCGYSESFTGKCRTCGSKFLYSSGTGTQRIEDELLKILPDARILRMDADTTINRDAYEKGFDKFRNGDYDVMVGTQMIAKGLDFENVTLVGVMMIDKSLYAGDYLGYEKTFSLITQVVGRCGRGAKKGRAYLQTFTPDHYVLNLAASQNYDEFFKQETEVRKTLLFPPFCDICVIGFSAFDDSVCEAGAKSFLDIIAARVKNSGIPIRILGPSKCSVTRINGKFRYRLIIKCKNNKTFRKIMSDTLIEAYRLPALEKVSFYADLNGEIT